MSDVEVQIEKAPRPLWGQAKQVKDLLGIPENVLRDLDNSGLVRSKKLGRDRRATRVYRIGDLLEFLEGNEEYPES